MLPSMLVAFNNLKVFTVWLLKGEKPEREQVESAVREEVFVRRESETGCAGDEG
jgi:hypothetical protein